MSSLDSNSVFGIRNGSGSVRSFVVLDKSFIQGTNPTQLKHYVEDGLLFGIPEVFWYEHLRKWDEERLWNLRKLKSVEQRLVPLPGIGEMFRAEAEHLKPAARIISMARKRIQLNERFAVRREFFDLDAETRQISEERTAELEKRLDDMVEIWRDFKRLSALKDAEDKDVPEIVKNLSLGVRDDHDDIRGFYKNHRHESHPPAVVIGPDWTFFRWYQVQLIGGLDFYASYGVRTPFKRDKLFNEMLDLEYLLAAVLVGGLASEDKRMLSRFKFLCPDGVVFELKHEQSRLA